MNREEAEEYAKNMSYRDAVYNALQGKCIPYRKATLIKLYELLDIVEPQEGSEKGGITYGNETQKPKTEDHRGSIKQVHGRTA